MEGNYAEHVPFKLTKEKKIEYLGEKIIIDFVIEGKIGHIHSLLTWCKETITVGRGHAILCGEKMHIHVDR